ncbi:MAG: hypothetical protein MK132_26940 [Lentisphaerales bacterium]|nr:hypothetical protein [Lentisphaerales bacterium]
MHKADRISKDPTVPNTSETMSQKQPVKMVANLSKEARELPYFRLPWMDQNYDRWSQTKIKRS